MSNIRFLGDLERLELKPGDRFVIHASRPLSQGQIDRIKSAWDNFVGRRASEFPVIVFDAGLKLGVIAPEAQAGEVRS